MVSSNETITLGVNFLPPVACMKTTQNVYSHIRTEEFNIAKFNSLLLALVTYLDAHNVEYEDKQLPWAEANKNT